jgi:hypothetical protein
MKKVVVVVVLLVVAYGLGYWPERQRRVAIEDRLARAEAEVAFGQARVRMAALLGQLLTFEDVVAAKNYGTALNASSEFFDAVRKEADRSQEAAFKAALEAILQMRDGVTAGLTKGDEGTVEILRGFETRLRNVLGYAPPPAPPAADQPTPVG